MISRLRATTIRIMCDTIIGSKGKLLGPTYEIEWDGKGRGLNLQLGSPPRQLQIHAIARSFSENGKKCLLTQTKTRRDKP